MLNLIITQSGDKIEETFLNTDGLNLNQLAQELCQFADRAAPRVAYQFCSNYVDMLQYNEAGAVSGEISIISNEKYLASISEEIDFNAGNSIDKLSRLEYRVREWIMKELAFSLLYTQRRN